MDRVPDCSSGVRSQLASNHVYLTLVPLKCDRCRSTVKNSAEEEEDCPGGTEMTAVKAGGGIRFRWNTAQMVSANSGECGRIYEKDDDFDEYGFMEGGRRQSPTTPKQPLPRTETMGQPSTHKNDLQNDWQSEKSPQKVFFLLFTAALKRFLVGFLYCITNDWLNCFA